MNPNHNDNKNPYSSPDKNKPAQNKHMKSDAAEKKQNSTRASGIVFGGLFVGIAGLYGLKFAGILPSFTLLHPGTLTLIPLVPTLISIFSKGPGPVSTPLLLISLYMLAATQSGMGFLWNYLFPASLLIIGISILSSTRIFRNRRVIDRSTGMVLRFPIWRAVLCHRKFTYTDGTPMPGAFLQVMCGGAHCDLTVSRTEDEVLIDATVLFGTADITLPEYSNIEIKNIPVVGIVRAPEGTGTAAYTDAPTFRIRSRTIFGTLDVRRGGNV